MLYNCTFVYTCARACMYVCTRIFMRLICAAYRASACVCAFVHECRNIIIFVYVPVRSGERMHDGY